jgi:ubiquinone/menaquinone biosynthesis C-methylase UbiE
MRKKNKEIENWTEYWEAPDKFRDRISQKNMNYFLSSIKPFLIFERDDIILDFGCGTCELAANLNLKVKEIHCADVSKNYLSIGQQKLSAFKNIKYYLLDKTNYTNLSILHGYKYNKIICLSVVQYYRNIQEVEELIKNVRKIAAPGSKFLIADMPTKKPFLGDVLHLIKFSFKGGFLIPALIAIMGTKFSTYSNLYYEKGLLLFNAQKINFLMKKLGLKSRIIKDQVTLNSNRIHLIVDF